MPPNAKPPTLQPNLLLAKSSLPRTPDWQGSHHLVGHTAVVVACITTLVRTLGQDLQQQFGLTQISPETLQATAKLAAYLHDWGKANHQFQGVVRYPLIDLPQQYRRDPKQHPQLIRHEVASVLLAWEFQPWLRQCPNADFMVALAAAGGHHLKLGGKRGRDTSELGEIREGSGDPGLYWYVNHPDFERLLRFGMRVLGLPGLPPKIKSQFSPHWDIKAIKNKRQEVFLGAFIEWEPDLAFLAVIKALLIAADAIGSASAQVSTNIQQWIQSELEKTLTEADLQKVIDAQRGHHPLRPFQMALKDQSTRVTLVRAGCGTGKTLGAYHWALRHGVGRKLFFCYPTTGTSTEGFLNYVHNQVESELLHSRSTVDLELACTGEEEDNGDGLVNEVAQKLEAFKAWGAKVNVCTVDTVLGLLQCHRRPLYCFPALANAAFVVDEVHCYDNALFGALLRFLQVVKAPILLMSASFLPAQVEAIRKAVGEPVEIIEGPQDIEHLPRYRFYEFSATGLESRQARTGEGWQSPVGLQSGEYGDRRLSAS